MRTKPTPSFKTPPINELICGVQFEGADGFSTCHMGLFAERIKTEYPKFEDQAPLPKLYLEGVVQAPQFIAMPPLRRVFYLKPPGNFLIQLQQERLLHNWRKLEEVDEYPRFAEAFRRFSNAWEMFQEFLVSAALPPATASIFELTYINHIVADGGEFPRNLWDFLAFNESSPKAIVESEEVNPSMAAMQYGWTLPKSQGHLTLDLKHGVRPSDDRQVLLLELTVRGKPLQSDDMSRWFDLAHESIVNTFDQLTTKTAHELWDKYE
jgi:uncharacterized protein (TIGR04255 family)